MALTNGPRFHQFPDGIDINKYPTDAVIAAVAADCAAKPGAELTFADLHANALKLLYILICHGVITMPEVNYDAFVRIYNFYYDNSSAEVDLTDSKVQLDYIFGSMVINPDFDILRLLGDEFADRGACDYLVMRILKKLVEAGVPLEFILSNHSYEWLMALATNAHKEQSTAAPWYEWDSIIGTTNVLVMRSLICMMNFIDAGLVSFAEIREFIEKIYFPRLKLLSYSQCGDRITLFTHAPFGLNGVKGLADKLGIQYGDTFPTEPSDIIRIIDNINAVFQENPNPIAVLQSLITPAVVRRDNTVDDPAYEHSMPGEHLIWNRGPVLDPNRPASMCYAFGHVTSAVHPAGQHGDAQNYFNLNNELGISRHPPYPTKPHTMLFGLRS